MSRRDLRPHAAKIDDDHRDGQGVADGLGASPAGASRRSFLRRAATGGALAFGAAAVPAATMIPEALAQTVGTTSSGSTGTTPNSTPGTTPGTAKPASETKKDPPRISGVDLEQVVYLQTLELSAAQQYDATIATGQLNPPIAHEMSVFRSHHEEQAKALGEIAASEALGEPNATLTAQLTGRLDQAKDMRAMIRILYDLEESLTATYAFAMGVVEDWQTAAVLATIQPVQSQHALRWSLSLEDTIEEWSKGIDEWIPNFQNDEKRLDPAQYAAS